MTVRTQIALDPDVHREARRKAADLGISLAEYIRQLVATDLRDEDPLPADITDVFDLGDGGQSDIAVDKNRMLGAALSWPADAPPG